MRYFARPVGIERLSLEARLLYTAFCVFLVIGTYTSVWFYMDDQLGVVPADAVRYYLGDDAVESPIEAGGPALELPDDVGPDDVGPDDVGKGGLGQVSSAGGALGEGMRFEKPARQVMETFHFHLFSVPVVLLIIGHLFMMCGLPLRTKAMLIVLASISALLHLLAPPLIRFVSPAFSSIVFLSAIGMIVTWSIMTVWPVWEMWRPGPAGSPGARDPDAPAAGPPPPASQP
jgi:hypothetical protein